MQIIAKINAKNAQKEMCNMDETCAHFMSASVDQLYTLIYFSFGLLLLRLLLLLAKYFTLNNINANMLYVTELAEIKNATLRVVANAD